MKELKMNIQFFAEAEEHKEEPEKDPIQENMTEVIENLQKKVEETENKYKEAVKTNKELTESILNGGEVKKDEVKTDNKETIKKLRNELYGSGRKDMSNLETVKKTLALREAIIAEGKEDPFLPTGTNVIITEEDRQKAKNVASVMQECIDYAEEAEVDKEGVFTNEIMRRTKDVAPQSRRR